MLILKALSMLAIPEEWGGYTWLQRFVYVAVYAVGVIALLWLVSLVPAATDWLFDRLWPAQ